MIKGRNRESTNELGELVERCRSVLWRWRSGRAQLVTSKARSQHLAWFARV